MVESVENPFPPNFPQQLHLGDIIAQQLRQSNVLCLRRGQHDLHLQLATLDYWASSVKYGVAGPRLGSAWIVAGGRAMVVITKVSAGVQLEDLVTFGVHCDSLRLCDLEILYQVYYLISV